MMRYKHSLFLQSPESESEQDESGNFIVSEPLSTFVCFCREEPNGSGRKISSPDGENVLYNSIIHTPADCPNLDPGTVVIINDVSGRPRIKGNILRFSRESKNCRIWV